MKIPTFIQFPAHPGLVARQERARAELVRARKNVDRDRTLAARILRLVK